jgi:hypothetical protein
MLVTDSGLISERNVIWESLGDVDQSSSEFFNGNFNKPTIEENRILLQDADPIDNHTDLE